VVATTKLKEAEYFNKLDLIWGYNNVQIKEGNEWKAAFLTNKGLFEPQVMYFRLCNSPGTFQRMMNSIFQELLHKGVLANYMDDFVIPAKNHRRTRRKDDQVFEDSRETQSVFQKVKMRLQHGGNPYPRSHSREGTGQDGTRKDKSSEGVEDTNKSQGCRKFPRVRKLLPTIYPKLQPYSKAIEQTKK